MTVASPITLREAAHELGISPATVQRDVRLGCAGIVRPGQPGRGNGALLDLAIYRRWRDGDRDEDRVLRIAAAAALSTLRDHGGITSTMRGHAATVLALYLERLYRQLGRDDLPEECRTLLNVSLSCNKR